MSYRGTKSLSAQADFALSQAGVGGKPLRLRNRESFPEDLTKLHRIHGKAAPFISGELTFPRKDPQGPGGLCHEDLVVLQKLGCVPAPA